MAFPCLRLENFQGPLDLLFHLVQKKEVAILDLPISFILEQFLNYYNLGEKMPLEAGSDLLGYSSSLLWIKSRALLPKEEQIQDEHVKEEDPHFDIIYHLIDYCKYKEAAKLLAFREEASSNSFQRGSSSFEEVFKKPSGIDHISLEDLASIFQDAIAKAASRRGVIEEEDWKVSDKIKELKLLLTQLGKIALFDLFSEDKGKLELIALFLALLELMKLGEIKILKEKEQIIVFKA